LLRSATEVLSGIQFASRLWLNMQDANKKFETELLGFMRSVFYMVCRVVAMNSSI
jgi:hypothetical protein